MHLAVTDDRLMFSFGVNSGNVWMYEGLNFN